MWSVVCGVLQAAQQWEVGVVVVGGVQEMEMQDLVPVTVNAIPTAEKKEETESCTVELFL